MIHHVLALIYTPFTVPRRPALSVYFLYEPIGNLIIVRASGCQPANSREASIQLLSLTSPNLARQKFDFNVVLHALANKDFTKKEYLC